MSQSFNWREKWQSEVNQQETNLEAFIRKKIIAKMCWEMYEVNQLIANYKRPQLKQGLLKNLKK